ncbi:30S ribosomal protein S16 [bacterium]|nr:30S ribosomal protein S16 [bacterium]
MATKIRLRRTGTTNLALYRIVVADARAPRDGRFIENIGHYDPRKEGKEKVVVNMERLKYWLSVGAQMTESVIPLAKAQGIEIPVKKKGRSRSKKVKSTQAKPAEVKAE